MTLQLTSFNWNCQHIVTMNITYNLDHVFEHCIIFIPWLFVCSIEEQPEPEATPFVEDPDTEPRQQGKQPPFDHVDKTPFPSLSRLCMNRMITLCQFYRIVEPISFA